MLLSLEHLRGQQIDLEEIKELTTDPGSGYFYDSLLSQFLRGPYDFEMTKSISIYYGKLYSRYYTPYKFNPDEGNFEDMLRRENYPRAISLGERILEKDPVNFSVLLKLLRCYLETKDDDMAVLTRVKVDVLRKAILHSGTGDDMEAPYQVIDISDEYAMMAIMGLEGLSRRAEMKPSSVIDAWKVKPIGKGKKQSLYFELLLNAGPSTE
jgi:hypothetical protein